MVNCCCSKKCSPWCPLVILIYFVINFRVEAGIATALERGLDGLVAGVVLLLLLYISARFFGFIEVADDKGLLGRCCENKEEH
jgi:hypothetical protein